MGQIRTSTRLWNRQKKDGEGVCGTPQSFRKYPGCTDNQQKLPEKINRILPTADKTSPPPA